jgi:four helix bundle protein
VPTIKQFEHLAVWQSARKLVNQVYELTRGADFARDFALRDQIRKAAISVMSNIAEGFDAGYDGEFIRFLGYSFRSAAEVQSQRYTAKDQNYVGNDDFQSAYDQAVDVRKQIRGLVTYLTESKRKGRQLREETADYWTAADAAFVDNQLEVPAEFMAKD